MPKNPPSMSIEPELRKHQLRQMLEQYGDSLERARQPCMVHVSNIGIAGMNVLCRKLMTGGHLDKRERGLLAALAGSAALVIAIDFAEAELAALNNPDAEPNWATLSNANAEANLEARCTGPGAEE